MPSIDHQLSTPSATAYNGSNIEATRNYLKTHIASNCRVTTDWQVPTSWQFQPGIIQLATSFELTDPWLIRENPLPHIGWTLRISIPLV